MLSPPPHLVFLHHHRKLQDAMAEYQTLLRKSVVPPTWCRELVQGKLHFVGMKDVYSYGMGNIMVGEGAECTPTIFWLQ